MKKLLSLCITLGIFLSSQAFAQLSLGIEGGANLSSVKIDKADFINPKMDYNYFVGLSPNYNFNKVVGIRIPIQYSVKGFESAIQDFRYSYLDFMPMLEIKPISMFSVFAGVNFGMKLVEEVKEESKDWEKTEGIEYFKNTDVGAVVGARIIIKKLYLKVAYNYGILDIGARQINDENGNEIQGFGQFNRNIQIGIGYDLSFGR